jgi:phosphoglycolate phosphatase
MAIEPLTPVPDSIVFDFDGVIIDSRAPVRSAVAEALAAHGFPPRADAELDWTIGPPAAVAFAKLTGEPEQSAAVAECVATYRRAYERVYLEQTTLVDGIERVLGGLRPPLALATAKETEFVGPLLDALGIAAHFEVVCGAGPDEHKPTIVGRALRELGANDAAVVGDRSFDVEAAEACGARAVGVTWGVGSVDELQRAGARVIVDRPSELLEVLPSCR